jgi:hypothetical protein
MDALIGSADDLGEPEGIVEFTVGEQAPVRGDPDAVEFELDPVVESGPQRQLFGFTRRVPHDHARRSSQAPNSVSKIGRNRHQTFEPSGESALSSRR